MVVESGYPIFSRSDTGFLPHRLFEKNCLWTEAMVLFAGEFRVVGISRIYRTDRK